VVIVTHNRREEVLRAIRSAVAQRGDIEVLVMDDGSTDGTTEAIRAEFPHVNLTRFEESEEVVARRNRAAELATAPILIGIDDDSEFTSPDVVAQNLAAFDNPRVGAVALPLIDLPRGDAVRQVAPDGEALYVTEQFMGAACALRRSAFLEVGGYRRFLLHQSEEPDLCIRLLDSGYVVALGRGDPVRHHGSLARDTQRMWFRACRNDVLFGWNNVPMPDLLGYWAKTVPFQLWLGRGVGHVALFARGLLAGFAEVVHGQERRPVSGRVYRLYRRLGKHGPLRLDEVEGRLPRTPR
jgi:GT2 family glycosyltransferase